jgi:uncharacterized membrane protein YgcG
MRAIRATAALLAAAVALLYPAAASSEERILRYFSDVEIRRNSDLNVTETIAVNAEGDRIRRGIYRDFPTRYARDGRPVRIGFEVQEVTRNGAPEHWTTESIDNGVRVRIGNADRLLEPGTHVYGIRYHTTRQTGFFGDYDELYWNVTGNGWDFPIDVAEARIRLPDPVPFGQRAVYTGQQGAQGEAAEVSDEVPGEITFRTTAPLGPYEGLTVAVAFPKGTVEQPPPPSAAAQTMERYLPPIVALLALFGLGVYYFIAWQRVGRGPRAGPVIPLFAPPDGMSAAALRYVRRMGYDNRAFAAAIVEAGVRGKLRLVEEGKSGFFSKATTRIDRSGDPADMPPPERAMLQSLLSGGSIEVDQANHSTFRAAQDRLRTGLAAAYEGRLFRRNLGWAAFGLALLPVGAATIAAAIALTDSWNQEETARPALRALLLLGGAAAAILARARRPKDTTRLAFTLLAWLLAVPGAVIALELFVIAADTDHFLLVFVPLLSLPLVASAFWWMAAPTREGRAVMDQIEGFRHYLDITEEDRLEALHPPQQTPELFERYLPYAIALGVENSWAGRFSGVLAAAAADPEKRNRHIGWYSGRQQVWANPRRFSAAIGSALVSSIASASTAPGSSSGSGGSGSSGGGGGGGGGGGW